MSDVELIARALITDGERVLLAQPVGSDWYFLPGGHVEAEEAAVDALRRELAEELGATGVQVGGLLAVTETRYTDNRGDHHELNLVFDVTAAAVADTSLESHLAFTWFDRRELTALEIRPTTIGDVVRSAWDGPRLRLLSEGFAAHPRP
jgi:8-oxo-dGTP pyrophosphatase MutT (NUDIX family)